MAVVLVGSGCAGGGGACDCRDSGDCANNVDGECCFVRPFGTTCIGSSGKLSLASGCRRDGSSEAPILFIFVRRLLVFHVLLSGVSHEQTSTDFPGLPWRGHGNRRSTSISFFCLRSCPPGFRVGDFLSSNLVGVDRTTTIEQKDERRGA